jgi:hypothetical protein
MEETVLRAEIVKLITSPLCRMGIVKERIMQAFHNTVYEDVILKYRGKSLKINSMRHVVPYETKPFFSVY